MSSEFNELVSEVERLASMGQCEREYEGVYAKNTQLKFLLKKLNANKDNLDKLNGIEYFVSDMASSDSKILKLLDDYLEILRDR